MVEFGRGRNDSQIILRLWLIQRVFGCSTKSDHPGNLKLYIFKGWVFRQKFSDRLNSFDKKLINIDREIEIDKANTHNQIIHRYKQ